MRKRRVVSAADRTYNGVVYRSGFEARLAEDLSGRGRVVEYEAETLWYTTVHFSWPDWSFTSRTGKKIIVESKGWFPPEDKTKVLRLIECNPEVDYRLLFERSTPKFEKWAKKHGIKHAVRVIPDAWFEE